MIGVKAKTRMDPKKVTKAARAGSIQSLGHAGAALRLTAKRSIRRSQKPSTPGTPPHTRAGQLKRAIVYAVEKDKQSVVIGPAYGEMGPSAMPHEHGGAFRGGKYPRRPFMGPALAKIKDRLPKEWANSVR